MQALGAVPVFAWETCLALHLLAKGFRSPAGTPVAPPAAYVLV